MPVSGVTAGDTITEAWGDSVASSVTALEAAGPAHVAAADPHPGYRLESAAIGTADLAADSVTYPKMQNVSATNRVLGRATAGAGDPEELTAAQVMGMLPSVDVQVFTGGSGNWTKPAGARYVKVRCVGGGGSGGSAASTSAGEGAAASGGGAGGYAEKIYAASALSATEAYAVGAGGAAPAAGNNNGNNGGNSTFKGLTASAGERGLGAPANSTGPKIVGGNGGAATGGDLNSPGGDGATSALNVGTVVALGDGGASTLGTTARAANNVAGAAGHAYGGGGAGGTNSANQGTGKAGGAGAAGVIIVESYP